MPTKTKRPKPKPTDLEALTVAGTPGLLAVSASNGQWKMARHLKLLDHLAVRLAQRKIKRLIITLPPRHGKSSFISKWFASWWLGVFPDEQVILTSYSADLAFYWSARCRQVLEEYGQQLFGVTVNGSAGGWGITGRQGRLQAAGVGGPITGFGAHLLIADDLLKNAEEAQSETVRQSTWDWWTSTAWTRLEPGGVCVLIGTRWNLDDPIGRILKAMQEDPLAEPWHVVNLPAICEEDEEPYPVSMGRRTGEALWPERYDLAALQGIRKQLGEYWWQALYQQSPVAKAGGMFRAEYFSQRVKAAPYNAKRIRYWDKAASEGKGCATAGVLLARSSDGNFYIEHCVTGHWEPYERDEKILATAHRDRDRYQKNAPAIYAEHEPGSSGVDSYKALARKLAGFPIYPDRPSGKKEVRSEPWASQCAAKNVYLVDDGTWDVSGYIEEHTTFPFGKLVDRVDASSGAFGKLLSTTASSSFGGMRICNAGRYKKAKQLRIVACTKADLKDAAVEEPAILASINDPSPTGSPDMPPHALAKLIGWIPLQFSDLDPAEIQARIEKGETSWDGPVPPYGNPAAELMMTKDHARGLWTLLLAKLREQTFPHVLVIADDGDRRATSVAYGVADALCLPRASSVWRMGDADDVKHEGQAPNRHVYNVTKSGRHLVL